MPGSLFVFPHLKLDHPQNVDWYKVLSVPRTASAADIKAAYHRYLLQNHPDKNTYAVTSGIDIASIKAAYLLLSSPHQRAQYDAELKQQHYPTGPRPAQVVSLEEFTETIADEDQCAWFYACRCGGVYKITESDMIKGQHLISCTSCSEAVWVGYEEVNDGDGE